MNTDPDDYDRHDCEQSALECLKYSEDESRNLMWRKLAAQQAQVWATLAVSMK